MTSWLNRMMLAASGRDVIEEGSSGPMTQVVRAVFELG